MSKRSRRERRRAHGTERLKRFTRSAPNNCVTCAVAALSDNSLYCDTHGPLTHAQIELWRRAHPGYAKAADEDRVREEAYMRAHGRPLPPPKPIS